MAFFGQEDDWKLIPEGFRSVIAEVREATVESLIIKAQPVLGFSKLEKLDIYVHIEAVNPQIGPDQCAPGTFALASETVQRLQIRTNIRPALRDVLSSPLRQLRSMHVSIVLGALDILVNRLRGLPSLEELSFDIVYNETLPKMCHPLRQSDISRLRSLNISAGQVSIEVLLNIFTQNDALIGVEDFGLRMYGVPSNFIQFTDLLRFLHSLRNTRRITLPRFEFDNVTTGADVGFELPIHMPNLLNLGVHFLDVFSYIDAPLVRSLRIMSFSTTPLKAPNNFAREVASLQMTETSLSDLIVREATRWESVKDVKWSCEVPGIGLKTTHQETRILLDVSRCISSHPPLLAR
jgi:hypothetical protein